MNDYLFIVFDTERTEIIRREKIVSQTKAEADSRRAELKSNWNAPGEDRYLVYMLQI